MAKSQLIGVDGHFEIRPEQIDTSRQFIGAFGHFQTEESARFIVQFCQERGEGWKPFTQKDINQFYRGHADSDPTEHCVDRRTGQFRFNHLVGEFPLLGWEDHESGDKLVRLDAVVKRGKLFFITEEFVKRCYASSPVRKRRKKT